MYICALLNHKAKSCWKGQSCINLLFCEIGELTVQTKRLCEKEVDPPKYKYFIGLITSILSRKLWQVKEPPKINKMFSILKCFVLLEFLFLLFSEQSPYQKKWWNTPHFSWHWLPSCVSLKYSYGIALPSSNRWAFSEQTKKYLAQSTLRSGSNIVNQSDGRFRNKH